MILILIFMVLIFFIAGIFYLINLLSSKKFYIDREKISPFECGFDPICSASMPFTIQFFLISLIFLIFDIEIVLLFPLIFFLKLSLYNLMIWLSLFFVNLLMLGLIFEWTEGYINWIY